MPTRGALLAILLACTSAHAASNPGATKAARAGEQPAGLAPWCRNFDARISALSREPQPARTRIRGDRGDPHPR